MMKKIVLSLGLLALLSSNVLTTQAADAAPAPPKPSVEDRLTDLEAYVTNGARQTNAPTALAAIASLSIAANRGWAALAGVF